MTGSFVLNGAAPTELLSHLALYGLCAILEDAGKDVRLAWTTGMQPRPQILGVDATDAAIAVRAHATTHAQGQSWVNALIDLPDKDGVLRARGLLSPRLPTIKTPQLWRSLQQTRHEVLDELSTRGAFLDLAFLGALGEPAYWRSTRKGEALQDDGASRLEMQSRNGGNEFVQTKLAPLANVVANWAPEAIAAGICGRATNDELACGRADSRTPTGLRLPGPVDNALVWCALWGIAWTQLALRTQTTAATSLHGGDPATGFLAVPAWNSPWSPARARTVLTRASLKTLAKYGNGTADDYQRVTAAQQRLRAYGCASVVRFPIFRSANASAPERWAQLGTAIRLKAP